MYIQIICPIFCLQKANNFLLFTLNDRFRSCQLGRPSSDQRPISSALDASYVPAKPSPLMQPLLNNKKGRLRPW